MDYSLITSSIAFGSFFAIELPPPSIKILCSYGGRILPCRLDGKLRYAGGHTRVLTVRRGISFSELQAKLREMCGWKSVSLRCQLPTEDMDTLVSITSSKDLDNLIEEYHCIGYGLEQTVKIRAFLFCHTRSPITTNPAPTTQLVPITCTVDRTDLLAMPSKFHCRYERPSASVAARKAYIRRLHGRHRGTPKQCKYMHRGGILALGIPR